MPLSNAAVAVVLQALKSITADPDQCFTAFDVTKAARNLTGERISHDDVRELMHAFFDQGLLKNYQRIPRTFWHNGRQVDAQIFCPPNGDIFAYDPDQVTITKLDDHYQDDDVDLDDTLDPDVEDPVVQQDAVSPAKGLVGAIPDTSKSSDDVQKNAAFQAALKKTSAPPQDKLDLTDPLSLLKKVKSKLSRFWGL